MRRSGSSWGQVGEGEGGGVGAGEGTAVSLGNRRSTGTAFHLPFASARSERGRTHTWWAWQRFRVHTVTVLVCTLSPYPASACCAVTACPSSWPCPSPPLAPLTTPLADQPNYQSPPLLTSALIHPAAPPVATGRTMQRLAEHGVEVDMVYNEEGYMGSSRTEAGGVWLHAR